MSYSSQILDIQRKAIASSRARRARSRRRRLWVSIGERAVYAVPFVVLGFGALVMATPADSPYVRAVAAWLAS